MSQETRNAIFYDIQRPQHFDFISQQESIQHNNSFTMTSVRVFALNRTVNWMMCKLYPPSIFANKEKQCFRKILPKLPAIIISMCPCKLLFVSVAPIVFSLSHFTEYQYFIVDRKIKSNLQKLSQNFDKLESQIQFQIWSGVLISIKESLTWSRLLQSKKKFLAIKQGQSLSSVSLVFSAGVRCCQTGVSLATDCQLADTEPRRATAGCGNNVANRGKCGHWPDGGKTTKTRLFCVHFQTCLPLEK